MSRLPSRDLAVRAPVTREQLVAEARSWIGTPFHWQASLKGHGCDCKGLLVGVARELQMPEAESLAALQHSYRLDFSPETMLAGLEETLRRVEDPRPGDVVAIRISPSDAGPRHLAILTGSGRMVHCYGGGPFRKVLEVPVGHSRPIDSYWTWPSVGETDG